ncbi:MAG: hypothetical protein ACK5JT_12380 [Hyphomicrobiaceae bacterium]
MNIKAAIAFGAGVLVVAAIAAATGKFSTHRAEAITHARLGSTRLATDDAKVPAATGTATIGVGRIEITKGPAAGFGKAVPRPGPIDPDVGFNIYFEPSGLATRFQHGHVEASMTVDVLIRNADNTTVASQDGAWRLPLAVAAAADGKLGSVYGDLSVNPLHLADGDYQIVLRIHDDVSGRFVDRVLNVEVKDGADGTQRLSQARRPDR